MLTGTDESHKNSTNPLPQIPAGRPDILFSAVVKAKESLAQIWTESVKVVSASASGVGFYGEHKCFVGQALSLMIPMPVEFRRYDTDKKFYKVWGLVQHCNPLADHGGFHIGVAFIGPAPPEEYSSDPTTSYRVSGIGSDGFWVVNKAERPFKKRKHSRFQGSIEVNLILFDPEGSELGTEKAFTENVSETGAAIFSNAPLDVGEMVRFSTPKYRFQTTAMIRNRQNGKDGRPRLHLEFVDALFPISQLTNEH